MLSFRLARADDADAMARLHAAAVAEGFLPTLGLPFLRLLHHRIARSSHSFAIVADRDGEVVGMGAATQNVRLLYRDFLVRDGAHAVVVALPRLVRAARRAFETLRYPNRETGLPPAEILVVAVAESARKAGVGRELLALVTKELEARQVRAVRVVTTAGNTSARALYRTAGFRDVSTTEIHRGTESLVLVRSTPSGSAT